MLPLSVLASTEDVVEIEPVAPVEVHGSMEAMARVVLRVKPGFHVQANPVLNPDLIPIELSLETAAGLRAGAPIYPSPSRLRLVGTDEDLLVLDGRFTIAVPIRMEAVPPGERRVAGKLRYQACDHEHCLFPRSRAIELAIRPAASRP
jgi:hypothetical protein